MEKNITLENIAIHSASLGCDAISGVQFKQQTNCLLYAPGYVSVASCKSKITFIDGEKGKLIHRGYAIEDLVNNCDYTSLMYLLLNEDLPNEEEKKSFKELISKKSKEITKYIKKISITNSPMHDLAQAILQIGGIKSDESQKNDYNKMKEDAIDILAYTPTLIWHIANKKENIEDCGDFEWYYEKAFNGFEDKELLKSVMDKILMLHADHEQNASTTSVRNISSTNADLYMSIASGVGALSGPLHGKANLETMSMLEGIKNANVTIEEYMENVKNKKPGYLLYGFGHRVYKFFDPRANILYKIFSDIQHIATDENNELLKIANKLKEIALSDQYFKDRNLYPNVDFYSGLVLTTLGIKKENFTLMFAFGRIVGWLAHALEQKQDKDTKIARPFQIYEGETDRKVKN